MNLFLIGHHSGPIIGSYLLPFFAQFLVQFLVPLLACFLAFCIFFQISFLCLYVFAQILVQFSGASFGMFFFSFCILHLFFRFLSSVAYVSLFFAQILMRFSGASIGMVFCILHLFCISSSYSHSWPYFWLEIRYLWYGMSWAFLFIVCLMGFMFGHSVAQMFYDVCNFHLNAQIGQIVSKVAILD